MSSVSALGIMQTEANFGDKLGKKIDSIYKNFQFKVIDIRTEAPTENINDNFVARETGQRQEDGEGRGGDSHQAQGQLSPGRLH